jgi:hypothetical protein
MEPIKALTYIRKEVTLPGEPFIPQWSALAPEDKADLRRWAVEEGKARGINVVDD